MGEDEMIKPKFTISKNLERITGGLFKRVKNKPHKRKEYVRPVVIHSENLYISKYRF